MKNQEKKTQIPCSHHHTVMFCRKHPEIDLTAKKHDAAYEKAFYTPSTAETGEYAQNTTTWD